MSAVITRTWHLIWLSESDPAYTHSHTHSLIELLHILFLTQLPPLFQHKFKAENESSKYSLSHKYVIINEVIRCKGLESQFGYANFIWLFCPYL